MLFCRFRRKKSGNDWILASAKAMDIEVDEDLYPFVKFKRDYYKDFKTKYMSIKWLLIKFYSSPHALFKNSYIEYAPIITNERNF